MLENTHPFAIIIIAVLAALLVNNPAFQAAFIPIATGEWVWYVPFQICRSVAIYILFGCSILAALVKLTASLLGSGAAYVFLGAKWGAYAVGAVSLVVVGTLVAVSWCTAVHDISRRTFLRCKALLGYEILGRGIREVR